MNADVHAGSIEGPTDPRPHTAGWFARLGLGQRIAAFGAGVVFASVGVAYASIPDSSGVIHTCFGNNGALKVIDTDAGGACSRNETALTWSQNGTVGPQGPAGPAGPQGATGPAGPPGAGGLPHAAQAFSSGFPMITAMLPSTQVIVTLSLPAGRYVINGNASLMLSSIVGADHAIHYPTASCYLLPNTSGSQTVGPGVTNNNGGLAMVTGARGTIAVSQILTLPTDQAVTLNCGALDSGAEIQVTQGMVVAFAVAP